MKKPVKPKIIESYSYIDDGCKKLTDLVKEISEDILRNHKIKIEFNELLKNLFVCIDCNGDRFEYRESEEHFKYRNNEYENNLEKWNSVNKEKLAEINKLKEQIKKISEEIK